MERDYQAVLWDDMPVTVTLVAEIDKGKRTVPEVRSASWRVDSVYVKLSDGHEYALHIQESDRRVIEKQLRADGEDLVREVLAQKPAWAEA